MGLVLSLDCVPLEPKLASIIVWESSTHFGRSQLCRIISDTHPDFDSAEEVSLCPTVLAAICVNFEVYYDIYIFASVRHHQLHLLPLTLPTDRQSATTPSTTIGPRLTLYINHT